jgi:predicted NUDIX family NTP pyrophosphohydrolase
VPQSSGKRVTIWALEGEFDAESAVSNTFEVEWPRGSGRMQSYPEIDRAQWFEAAEARNRIVRGQLPFLDRLVALLG